MDKKELNKRIEEMDVGDIIKLPKGSKNPLLTKLNKNKDVIDVRNKDDAEDPVKLATIQSLTKIFPNIDKMVGSVFHLPELKKDELKVGDIYLSSNTLSMKELVDMSSKIVSDKNLKGYLDLIEKDQKLAKIGMVR